MTGSDYGANNVGIANVDVTLTDNDVRGVRVSEPSLIVGESLSGSYTVALRTEPTAPVTVQFTTSNPTIASISLSDHMFTSSTWNTPVTVNVTGVSNDIDHYVDQTATIGHKVIGGEYEGVTASNVSVTVNDNDTRGVTLSRQSATIVEGNDYTYTIRLATRPISGAVMVMVTNNSDEVTVSPASVEFDTADWNTPQMITIDFPEDDFDNDLPAHLATATISHRATGADYSPPGFPGSAWVSISDFRATLEDDDTRGITVTETEFMLTEGETGTYTITLHSAPTYPLIIQPYSSDSRDVEVVPDRFEFDRTNWSFPVTVFVTAVQDDIDERDTETTPVQHEFTNGGDYSRGNVRIDRIPVTVTDDDTRGVAVNLTTLTVPETQNRNYTIVLLSEPTRDVTITLTDNRNAAQRLKSAISPTSLTFTADNWNDPQNVTVNFPDNTDIMSEDFTISHAVAGGDNAGGITVSPPSVTFTTTNWNTPRIVTVRSSFGDDAKDETATITHSVTNYGANSVVASLTVNVEDPERQRVTVSTFSLQIEEGGMDSYTVALTSEPVGGDAVVTVINLDTNNVSVSPEELTYIEELTGAYTVVLSSQPTGTVIVKASSNNPKVTVNRSVLRFTAANWNRPQRVTLGSPHDDDTNQETAIISHTVTGGDYGLNNVTAQDVFVTVDDNDTDGVTIHPTTLRFTEGGRTTYTVRLRTRPIGVVRITVLPSDSRVTVSPRTLTFGPATWNIPQTVTVSAGEDSDEEDDTLTLTHNVDGYGLITMAATVATTVTEYVPLSLPANLTATVSDGVVTLHWSPPPTGGERRPTDYQVRHTPYDPADWGRDLASDWIDITGGAGARTWQITGLINQANYTFQVRSVDRAFLEEVGADDDDTTAVDVQLTYSHRTRDCATR